MNKLLVILGPTVTGKTDLALDLAKKLNGELVACDSRQVYQGLDIGTGKMPGRGMKNRELRIKKEKGFWEINGVKIWLYDVIDLSQQYTVSDYVRDAERTIADIYERGKLPIIVGGTGFYLKALLEGIPNLEIPVDQKLRKQLNNLTREQLQDRLKILSINKWNELNESDQQNPRRLVRAIELISMSPHSKKIDSGKWTMAKYNVLKIGLFASREILYKRSDLRVLNWIDQGIIAEVEILTQSGIAMDRFQYLGLEYRIIADYIAGKIQDKNELIKTIQNNIHGYIRRQQTWFKTLIDVNWYDISDHKYPINIEKVVNKWYY